MGHIKQLPEMSDEELTKRIQTCRVWLAAEQDTMRILILDRGLKELLAERERRGGTRSRYSGELISLAHEGRTGGRACLYADAVRAKWPAGL